MRRIFAYRAVGPTNASLIAALTVQAVATVVILFVPIGFDHAPSFGLDFNDFVLVCILHCLAFCCGVIVAIIARKYLALIAQVILILILAFVILREVFYPADYQPLWPTKERDIEEPI
jgi:hypothetical protein